MQYINITNNYICIYRYNAARQGSTVHMCHIFYYKLYYITCIYRYNAARQGSTVHMCHRGRGLPEGQGKRKLRGNLGDIKPKIRGK